MVEVVLVVEDIDRSMAFYHDTLGLEPISPPSLPVKFLRIGAPGAGVPQQVVLIPRHLAAAQPLVRNRALHHIGLEVAPEDYDRGRSSSPATSGPNSETSSGRGASLCRERVTCGRGRYWRGPGPSQVRGGAPHWGRLDVGW